MIMAQQARLSAMVLIDQGLKMPTSCVLPVVSNFTKQGMPVA